jgi:hypothetical protein
MSLRTMPRSLRTTFASSPGEQPRAEHARRYGRLRITFCRLLEQRNRHAFPASVSHLFARLLVGLRDTVSHIAALRTEFANARRKLGRLTGLLDTGSESGASALLDFSKHRQLVAVSGLAHNGNSLDRAQFGGGCRQSSTQLVYQAATNRVGLLGSLASPSKSIYVISVHPFAPSCGKIKGLLILVPNIAEWVKVVIHH